MNLLLLGNGGREHAIAWKLKQSPLCEKLYIAPGNPGTALCGTNIPLAAIDFEGIKTFCLTNSIDMVVVGPEDPLVKGVYDYFLLDKDLKHIPVIGPSKLGAQLEGSKSFAKQFMERHKIPTARYREFDASNLEEGCDYIDSYSGPYVLKADGLAAGKGVLIIDNAEEAKNALREMIAENKFGKASAKVVIEQFLKGIEFSVFLLTDGQHYKILPNAKDYKRVGEGDTGLNTGGMGAISPVPFVDENLMQKVTKRILTPTIEGFKKDEIVYKGFVYVGLILVAGEPFVIEYNCRMGDPETEVVMPRLESDLVALLKAVADEKLNEHEIRISDKAACTVVLTSGGYPEDFEKGKSIILPTDTGDSTIFHAGTKADGNKLLTNGGRVMALTSLAPTLKDALIQSLQIAKKVSYEGKYYRKDIGYEFE